MQAPAHVLFHETAAKINPAKEDFELREKYRIKILFTQKIPIDRMVSEREKCSKRIIQVPPKYIVFHFSLHYISKGGFPIRHAAKGILFAASLALVTTTFVPASLAKENHNNTANATETTKSFFYQTDTQFSYGLKAQSDASVSKPVKDAIREVLKNKTKLFNLVEKLAGKKIRNELESVFNQHIEPVLKKMLNEYVTLSWTDVEKNLYLSLKKSGLSDSQAKNLAHLTTLAMKAF